MNLGDWAEIEVVTEEGDTIVVITEDGDTPITCKDGYWVCLQPKAEDE